MTEPELITTADVAALLGGRSRQHARDWCARHHITPIRRDGDQRNWYPADQVHAALALDAQRRAGPAPLRLRRWVAKALLV